VTAQADWPGAGRRRPRRSSTTYAVRAPLARWLEAEAATAAARLPDGYRVLDAGCGEKPYYPFFAPFAREYVGIDIAHPAADVHAPLEHLPVADASYDLVLCTQALEHSEDPAQVVRELRRVVARGGRVLASTHGTQVYHPSPVDLWRWTHAGIERLFRDNGEWAALTVAPGSGTSSCVGMLLGIYVNGLARRLHVRPLGRGLVFALNSLAAALDARVPALREPRPGALFANYHVTATAP
jgi:SAM-dependent methyltransferase